jgi:formyltetrahydrofolate deformylase
MLEITSVIDRPSSAARRPPIDTHHLTLSCDNRPGIVSAVSTALFESGADITEAQQFDDMASGRFFMRVAFHLTESSRRIDALVDRFLNVAARFDMRWKMHRRAVKPRVLILASRQAHCLIDLLYQTRIGTLPMEVIGIASNHPPESLDAVVPPEIPYHYLPVEPGGKAQQERAILRLCDKTSADLVVLARYMQILSPGLCIALAERCINIHHSFLPGFKGAKPYSQAFERGVKMIGATAHYVTQDLDEGPIIAQDVENVTHLDTVESLTNRGRDIERRVLTRAVRYHLENRILLNGHKTVVFTD